MIGPSDRAVEARSQEYHAAHLAFARAAIVVAAARREPIHAKLKAYTVDVQQAERDRLTAPALSEDSLVRLGDARHDVIAEVVAALRRRPATMNPPMPQPGPFRSAADFIEREHREGRLP
jgi:hypothetical protein